MRSTPNQHTSGYQYGYQKSSLLFSWSIHANFIWLKCFGVWSTILWKWRPSLSTIWLKMIYFIRSVSDHGKCGIKLKFSTREFINVYFGDFQWLPWQRQSELVKNNKKSAIPWYSSVICHRPIHLWTSVSLLKKKSLLLTNSCHSLCLRSKYKWQQCKRSVYPQHGLKLYWFLYSLLWKGTSHRIPLDT